MEEQWKDIEGYEGRYQISSFGRVKSLPTLKRNGNGYYYTKEKIRRSKSTFDGYRAITLVKNGIFRTYTIHRLVAKAFVENPNNYNEINHIDEIKTNNRVDNLEWCTHAYNLEYGSRKEITRQKTMKPVLQFDRENKFIRKWNSGSDAARNLNIQQSSISNCCCHNRKTAGNYIWEFATGENNDTYTNRT